MKILTRIFHSLVGRSCRFALIFGRRGSAALPTNWRRHSPHREICRLNILVLSVTAGFLSGCLSRNDHTQFYHLSAPAPAPASAVEGDKVFLVGLRITSAEYLRSKQMLVEVGPNQMRFSEENLWQEAPQAGFARVLARRFAQILPNCQLSVMPLATTRSPELILEIELLSLQGRFKPKREAEISAEVRILDASGRLLERHQLRQTSPWSPTVPAEAYQALAAAESYAAAELADEIGRKVLAYHRKMLGL
jgi:uncharacterized lipoprotein YmbA